MLPYALFVPLWFLLAVAWPIVQSLHALQTGSAQRTLWLFYWMCFAAGSWIFYLFEWLIRAPFSLLAYVVDVYYESQLLLVCFLVFPHFGGIKRLEVAVAKNGRYALQVLMLLIGKRVSKSLFASASTHRTQTPNKGDRPGPYTLIKEAGVMPSLETAKGAVIHKLSVGDRIDILEVVDLEAEKRIRGRVKDPSGWITLLNSQNGTRWAVHNDDFGNMQPPSMMPEATSVFANATAAGCDPAALFQSTGPGNIAIGEVSNEDAWEAMAMLESQLARADDFSEDAASRQASQMLRQMLTMLTQNENPGMLTMAQAMMPDLGKIWANESTRAYLKDFLSGTTHEAAGNALAGGSNAAASSTAEAERSGVPASSSSSANHPTHEAAASSTAEVEPRGVPASSSGSAEHPSGSEGGGGGSNS